MKIVLPWAFDESERLAIERSARSVIGSTIARVRYLLPYSSDVNERIARPGYDVADMGVEFTAVDGSVFTTLWFMEGEKEGLGFVLEPTPEYYASRWLKVLDVTSAPEWTQFSMSPIVAVALARDVPNEGMPIAVWSLRLAVGSGLVAVVALGDDDGRPEGQLRYQPDNVLVIFDAEVALRYKAVESGNSAWGLPVTAS
jgi:hypothetical protein